MAKVLKQGFKPLTNYEQQFIPNLDGLQCGTQYAKTIAALPAYLSSAMAEIVIKTGSTIGKDDYNWFYPITEKGERISLVIAIINSNNEVCTYIRKDDDIRKEQNSNIGFDAIGSRGYAVNGLYDRIPVELWGTKIKSVKIAKNYAWEKTDGINDCKNVIMPIILIELVDSPLCAIPIQSFENKIKTAKLDAVIEELKLNK